LPRNRPLIALVVVIFLVILAGAAIYVILNLNGNIPSIKTLPIPVVSVAANWAGYVVANDLLNPTSAVSSVSGSWIVPAVKDIGTDAYSSVWIGIGGQFDHSLIQVGTEQDFTNGSARYYAWYEMLPSYSVPIDSIKISPGDQMHASISLEATNSSQWSISIEDLTNGGKFQSNFTYDSRRLTAEWIVEQPQVNNALTTLANFGNVTFTDCNANLSGKSGGISSFAYNNVQMQPQIVNNKSVQLVFVSVLKNGSTQFTVNYIPIL